MSQVDSGWVEHIILAGANETRALMSTWNRLTTLHCWERDKDANEAPKPRVKNVDDDGSLLLVRPCRYPSKVQRSAGIMHTGWHDVCDLLMLGWYSC